MPNPFKDYLHSDEPDSGLHLATKTLKTPQENYTYNNTF